MSHSTTARWLIGGSEQMRLTSTGLGIGTSSPGAKLDVLGSANTIAKVKTTGSGSFGALQIFNSGTNGEASIGYRDDSDSDSTSWVVGKSVGGADLFGWYYNGTRMVLDTSGVLGIGATPSPWSSGVALLDFRNYGGISSDGSFTYLSNNIYYDGANRRKAAGHVSLFQVGNSGVPFVWQYAGTGAAGSTISLSEAMRIDGSGNLLVGTSSQFLYGARVAVAYDGGASGAVGISFKPALDDGYPQFFFNAANTPVGNIRTFVSSTTFNSLSDYRLKTVAGAVAGQGERIDALEPVEYTWNIDGSKARGFLAHKFQEVYPSSVTGLKDEVDAKGKPVYQAMQASTSEVIADLVAEIQSVRQRLAAAGI
jgi:hypothetical protein